MRAFTRFAAALAVLLASLAGAAAAELRRGVNFELWQHWTAKAEFVGDGYDRDDFPDWQKAVSDAQLFTLHAQGFDFVRLNVDPSPFFWIDAEQNRLLDGVIRATRRLQAAGFTVIVDLHLVPDQDDRPNGLHWVLGTGDVGAPLGFGVYTGLVSRFAARLASLPADRTLLELLNEPDQDWFSTFLSGDKWPDQLKALLKSARQAAPELKLVLSGGLGGSIDGLLRLDAGAITSDANVIWSFHYYEPYEISHSGLPWERNAAHFLTGLPYPASRLDKAMLARLVADADARVDAEVTDAGARKKLKAEIKASAVAYAASGAGPESVDAAFAGVTDWARRNAIPPTRILLGEFGVFQDKVAPETRAALIGTIRQTAESHGFAWAVYTAGLTQPDQSFGIVADAATLAVDPPVATALGLR
jgi:hypothetical protein